MPHRRRVKKNSFESHLDDLVKHFPEQPFNDQATDEHPPGADRSIHRRLFEGASRLGGGKRTER